MFNWFSVSPTLITEKKKILLVLEFNQPRTFKNKQISNSVDFHLITQYIEKKTVQPQQFVIVHQIKLKFNAIIVLKYFQRKYIIMQLSILEFEILELKLSGPLLVETAMFFSCHILLNFHIKDINVFLLKAIVVLQTCTRQL